MPNSSPPHRLIGRGASGLPGIGKCRRIDLVLRFGPPTNPFSLPRKRAVRRAPKTPSLERTSWSFPLKMSFSRISSGSEPCCWKALASVNPSAGPEKRWPQIRPSSTSVSSFDYQATLPSLQVSPWAPLWWPRQLAKDRMVSTRLHIQLNSSWSWTPFSLTPSFASSISSMSSIAKARRICGHPPSLQTGRRPRRGCSMVMPSSDHWTWHFKRLARRHMGMIGSMSFTSETMEPPGEIFSFSVVPLAKVTCTTGYAVASSKCLSGRSGWVAPVSISPCWVPRPICSSLKAFMIFMDLICWWSLSRISSLDPPSDSSFAEHVVEDGVAGSWCGFNSLLASSSKSFMFVVEDVGEPPPSFSAGWPAFPPSAFSAFPFFGLSLPLFRRQLGERWSTAPQVQQRLFSAISCLVMSCRKRHSFPFQQPASVKKNLHLCLSLCWPSSPLSCPLPSRAPGLTSIVFSFGWSFVELESWRPLFAQWSLFQLRKQVVCELSDVQIA